jgi:hypothetical protein
VSAIDYLKALRHEVVEDALGRWKGVDPESRNAVLNGRELALVGGVADAAMLTGLRRAIEAGTRGVMEIACEVANVLIERDEEAFSLVQELAASSTAQGRIGALLCMPAQIIPDVLARPILEALLKDRSRKVREMTVDWIRRNGLMQHVPMLEALLAGERNQAFREFLAREISLLKNGYYVHRTRESVHVTVRTTSGSYGSLVDPELARGLSDREIAEQVMSRERP